MSKSCFSAVVLAVILLLSVETDAQPTVDESETTSCCSSTLEEVVSLVKRIASSQQENVIEVRGQIDDVKKLLSSNDAGEQPLKQALVTALACE